MSRSARGAACITAGLAFASAATTAYWLFGGTALLDTLGGSVERLARDRSGAALAPAAAVVVVKSVGGLLALLLLSRARRGWRLIVGLDILAAAALCLWGAANVLIGTLVLSGAIQRAGIDRHALHWHVFLWTPGFSSGELPSRSRRRAQSTTGTDDALLNAPSHVDTCQITRTREHTDLLSGSLPEGR